jgi:hypothetical protein
MKRGRKLSLEGASLKFSSAPWASNADGSCFSRVIPALQADGHEVIAVQYGLDSFEEDVLR